MVNFDAKIILKNWKQKKNLYTSFSCLPAKAEETHCSEIKGKSLKGVTEREKMERKEGKKKKKETISGLTV